MLDSISLEFFEPAESQYKSPIKEKTKTLIEQSATMYDTDITDNDDPVENMILQVDDPFFPDFLLISNPPTSGKATDSGNEHLHLQTIIELDPPVIKQSLKISFFDPSFFKYTSKFIESFLPVIPQLNLEFRLKNQKRQPALTIVLERITGSSRPVE